MLGGWVASWFRGFMVRWLGPRVAGLLGGSAGRPNLVKVSVIFKPIFSPNPIQIQAMRLFLLRAFLLCKNPNK